MKAVVFVAPHQLTVKDVEPPPVGPLDVDIRIRMAGICGTDLFSLRGEVPTVKFPFVPGHEFMGEVMRAPAIAGLRVGQRVTAMPTVSCEACDACRTGHPNLCPEVRVLGVAHPHGGFAERAAVRYTRIVPIPDEIDDTLAALIEPCTVAVHINRQGGVKQGDRVVVIGGGVIGLLCAQVARALGAAQVVISEPLPSRRALARGMGFDLLCDPQTQDLLAFVRDTLKRADVVLDVVGTPTTLSQATEMLQPGGCLVLVAYPHDPAMAVPYFHIMLKELRVVGTRLYFAEDFPETMRLLCKGDIDPKPLVSAVFPLDQCDEAMRCLRDEPTKYVKVLLQV